MTPRITRVTRLESLSDLERKIAMRYRAMTPETARLKAQHDALIAELRALGYSEAAIARLLWL